MTIAVQSSGACCVPCFGSGFELLSREWRLLGQENFVRAHADGLERFGYRNPAGSAEVEPGQAS
jgi:hypothetical protein